jgi:hypothetical protein
MVCIQFLLPNSCYVPRPSFPFYLQHPNTVFKAYKLWIFSSVHFLRQFAFRSNILFRKLFSYYATYWSDERFSHPFETVGKYDIRYCQLSGLRKFYSMLICSLFLRGCSFGTSVSFTHISEQQNKEIIVADLLNTWFQLCSNLMTRNLREKETASMVWIERQATSNS